MAEEDVAVVKVFNYICGLGGVASFSQLLQHPSPLAKKSDASLVISWYDTAKNFGSFDSGVNGLLLATGDDGNEFGIRINLKKRLCVKYSSTGYCHLAGKCPFWHLCKAFLEGNCKGNFGHSHDFHDDDNKSKTVELGFEKKKNEALKPIIAGSLPQVCHSYLKSECWTWNCPHLHICPKEVLATECDHECGLSHDFFLPHNKNILSHFGFKSPQSFKVEVLRCNILVPKQQKALKDNQKQHELTRDIRRRDRDRPVMENLIGQATRKSATNDQTFAKQTRAKPITLSGLLEEAAKATEMLTASMCQTATTTDPLLAKVLNYVHGKGGVATLSQLLHHPSPLAKKFSSADDAKIWLQVQAQSDQIPKICLLENEESEILGVRILLKKKLCLYYTSKASCKKPTCQFWHVCKGYLEGKCSGDCGLSHDLHDEGNIKKVQMLGLEKHPRGTIKNIVANSLPQVCLSYLENECFSTGCPYLHICRLAAQGTHELTNADPHNMKILKQFELVPQPSNLNVVHCNILIPKQQRRFNEDKPNVGFVLSSPSRTSNMKSVSDIQPLMSLPCGDEMQGNIETSTKKKNKKGEKKWPRKRNKKKTCQDKQIGGLRDSCTNEEGLEENSSDSVSDNEDIEKPDMYASSKFTVDRDLTGNKDCKNKDPRPGRHVSAPIEENLISLSDDDWQGVNDPTNSPFFSNYELLSQVDEIFFGDRFGASNEAGSLSQQSGLCWSSDQTSPEQESASVNSVFWSICREYDGQVPFSEISQRLDLFPVEFTDIAAWFKKHQNKFVTIENREGDIEEVRAFHHRARICFTYFLSKNGCKDPKCFRYHVCKSFLANGVCPFGEKCRFSHSHNLKSPHNKRITSQLKLKDLSEEQLRILISASVPEVCHEYNNGSCQRGFRCYGIHICKNLVMGKCRKGEMCPFGHQPNLENPQAKLVLGRYNLSKVPARVVLGTLLVRGKRPHFKKMPKERAKPERTKVPSISDISWEAVSTLESEVLKRQPHESSFDLPIPLVPESPSAGPSRFPLQWTIVPENVEYIRVPLSTGSDEFKLAESYFRRSMSNKATILGIERVQNPFMWEKYARKKEQLEKRSSRLENSPLNEKLLFHGTDWQNVPSVCEENIDWRAQDEDRVAAFGQGAYFTTEAILGNTYCKQNPEGVRYMFLAEVLVGSSAKGEPSMKRPPQKSDAASNERNDSCVDNMDLPSLYVLFDSDQYYPTYMIQYKMKSKVVC
ncbi:uncharacterized protein [Montipora capricornis]|uniref:uncharacterized protein n=1 Tax=Montipora capricornis TaxID=246305 RepID=UPI0035F1C90E